MISHRTYETLISNAITMLYCQVVSYFLKTVGKNLHPPSANVSSSGKWFFVASGKNIFSEKRFDYVYYVS